MPIMTIQLSHESSSDTLVLRHMCFRDETCPSPFSRLLHSSVTDSKWVSRVWSFGHKSLVGDRRNGDALFPLVYLWPRFGSCSDKSGCAYDPGWNILMVLWEQVWQNYIVATILSMNNMGYPGWRWQWVHSCCGMESNTMINYPFQIWIHSTENTLPGLSDNNTTLDYQSFQHLGDWAMQRQIVWRYRGQWWMLAHVKNAKICLPSTTKP